MHDIELWHRDMPNDTDKTRIMLLTAHHRFWRDTSKRIQIPPSAPVFFDTLPLKTTTDLQPEDFDDLIQHEAHKFVETT